MVQRWFHHGDIVSGQVDLYMTDRGSIIDGMQGWIMETIGISFQVTE